MNNGELKTKLRNYSHRGDLDSQLQGFINTATERLNQRFGFTLANMGIDTDSNPVIANHGETLYFYAAMRELSVYIKDFNEAVRFDELFDKEAGRMNIHYRGDDWVTDQTVLTYVRSEEESLAISEEINGT